MKKRTAYTVDTIFVLVLFVIFAITVLFVLVSGAGVYKDTQAVMQERFEERTCISYINSKVNHYDATGKVYITEFAGVSALALEETVSNIDFVTYIYCYDGHVKELLFEKGLEFNPSAGQDIIDAKSLSFELEGNLIRVECVGTTGKSAYVFLNIASGTEAAK
ncbi:MAG: DUF4860 domain-containing protein [Ruminococcaceae bacterium]|nr:DUF4860 domain-containing protein [Oscillospiraceae bacterium]